ncbi:hypothetical protein FRC12_005493 [Ceratobasidium sp. 428]|nr:hypothetical protein FRC09_019166 [Ceratobasidium sp. 395]KAG8768569.1 hypothetical protein FRC12_005493 [Ceratobasidium sp. 428]
MLLTLITFVLEAAYFTTASPAGGSGGSRGGSGGGSRGGSGGSKSSSGGSKSSSGSSGSSGGYRYNNYHSSGPSKPLSKAGKIALAVVFGIIGLVVLIVVAYVIFRKLKARSHARKRLEDLMPEKQTLASSRTSFDEPADLSHNPGHTQAAVHPVSHPASGAEMTSAVMAGEGSKAGHGREGAGDGSRGGSEAVVWSDRALAVVSHGVSNEAHHQGHSTPEYSDINDKSLAPITMPVANPT